MVNTKNNQRIIPPPEKYIRSERLMVDKQMAADSIKIWELTQDVNMLGNTERQNLLDMIDEFIISQGWDPKEFIDEQKGQD